MSNEVKLRNIPSLRRDQLAHPARSARYQAGSPTVSHTQAEQSVRRVWTYSPSVRTVKLEIIYPGRCSSPRSWSSDNTANPYCLTWHYGAALTAYGCGPEQQEGSIISPDLTPWYPPTDGIPTALLTEASITLIQGAPTFFPSSTTTSTASQQPAGIMPTTIILATSTQFPIRPTTSISVSTKIGVRLGIAIAALLIFGIVVLI
jgi:uncharacterized protein YbaR (Trm112 family)